MSEHQVIEIKSLIESSFEKLKDLNISINDYLDDLRNKYNDKDEKIENGTDKPNKISLLANTNKHEMCHVGHALQIHPKWKKSKCNQCGDITKYLCWNCHHYDGRYDPPNHDKTSSKYYCCKDCGVKNAKKIKKRIINTTNKQNDIIKYYSNNPEIGFDMLCGLKNRLAFEYLLNEIVASNVDERFCFCLYILNIDNFKQINKIKGMSIGDQTLFNIAQILKFNTETPSIFWLNQQIQIQKIWTFRQHSDEFGIIVKGKKDKIKTQKKFVYKIKEEINGIDINVSIAMLCYGPGGKGAKLWLDLVYKALYITKNVKGKNSLRIYDGSQKGIVETFEQIQMG